MLRHVPLIMIMGIITALVLTACAPPGEQASPVIETKTEIIPVEASPRPEESSPFGEISCKEPFPPRDSPKPAISLDNLPRPSEPLLVTENRVIGYTFSDGKLAMLASPANAECWLEDPKFGQAAGVVWTFPDSNQPFATVVFIDPTTKEGFLFPTDLTDPIQISFEYSPLESLNGTGPPIDVSLRSTQVCFQLQFADPPGNYCSLGDDLSVRSLFPEQFAALTDQIVEATALLRTMGFLGEDDLVRPELTISEMEDFSRIKSCTPIETGSCPADVLVASIASSHNSPVNLGVMVVTDPIDLTDLPDGLILEPGSYVVSADSLERPELVIPPAWINGQTEAGETISDLIIPSSFALWDDPQSHAGLVDISGCWLWRICLFRQCR